MKKPVEIRIALVSIVFLFVLSLWFVYGTGYQRGVRAERSEWLSSASSDNQGNPIFLGPQAKAGFDAFFVEKNHVIGRTGK